MDGEGRVEVCVHNKPFILRTNPETKSKITDAEINSIQDIQEGQLLRGYVKSVQPHGVLFG